MDLLVETAKVMCTYLTIGCYLFGLCMLLGSVLFVIGFYVSLVVGHKGPHGTYGPLG